MPYIKIEKDDKICIYKKDADGKPEGDPLGCHESEEKADEQIAALYANEKKAVSLDEKTRSIREKIYETIKPASSPAAEVADVWVEELYEGFAILNKEGGYYRMDYSINEDGNITVGEMVEVEKDWKPKSKSIWKAIVPEPEMTLVGFGGEIKALDNGKLGGYLVRFTTADEPDLTGDYFSKDTDFDCEFPSKSTAYYNHGLDQTIKRRKLGKVDLTADDVGVWAEMQLQARDEYEKAILEMAKAGKLGWSSGTASHLVEREPVGKAMFIKRWPLGLDASLTPTPAEYRNEVIPLKSLSDYVASEQKPEAAQDAAVNKVSEPKETKTLEKEFKMDENEIKTLIENSVKEAAEQAAQEASAKAIEEYKNSLPAINEVNVIVEKDEKPFKSLGEQLLAVAGVATRTASEEQVNKLEAVKASGLNEANPAEGGFLVQSEFAAGLLKPIYELGAIASRVDKVPVGANSNGMTFNAVDETARTTGSRYGGVQAYWLAEAGTKTASKPKFRQMELKLKKLIGLCYATDELLQDAVALGAVISEAFRNEFTFMVEDAVINGSGIGRPLGLLNANAIVSVGKESGQAADTILAENIFKMWSRMAAPYRNEAVWLINQDVEPQLFGMYLAVGTGGVPVYLPANGLSGSPYGTMMGRPVIANEYCATVGDTGDIILANLKAYQMIDKGAIQEAQSIHVAFTTDETAFRFVYRCDGQPKWASAVTPAKGSNTVSPFVKLDERA